MTTITQKTIATRLINFHGLTLAVVEHENIEYIAAPPLVDLTGIQWTRARKTLFSDDNAILYGTKELNRPIFDGFGIPRDTKTAVYIRLDRSTMFLARVNTAQMRANGKENAADQLLKLQIEWAEALHSYETNGVAFKTQQRDKDIFGLLSKLDSVRNVELKKIYAQQLNEKFGIDIPFGNQQSLAV
jgi:Mor family transcriptional regulator